MILSKRLCQLVNVGSYSVTFVQRHSDCWPNFGFGSNTGSSRVQVLASALGSLQVWLRGFASVVSASSSSL